MNEWNKVDSHQRHIFLFYTIEIDSVVSEVFINWDDIIMIIVCHVCPLEEGREIATSLRHAQLRAMPCVLGHFFSCFSLMPVAKSCTTLFSSWMVFGSDSTTRSWARDQNEKSRQDKSGLYVGRWWTLSREMIRSLNFDRRKSMTKSNTITLTFSST